MSDIKLFWPTSHLPKQWPVNYENGSVNQPFGARPEYYRQFGMPAHSGIDFFLEYGDPIYACADGEVVEAFRAIDARDHLLGMHVRINHVIGDVTYQTVYSHMWAKSHIVKVGDIVKAGQVIGYGGSTGNSTGPHLDLMLKKFGATAAGETNYPSDVIDPTPYLVPHNAPINTPKRPDTALKGAPPWGEDERIKYMQRFWNKPG